MNLNRLNEFLTAARCRNIKKAAETLHIAPATLNARLCSFEASLGIPLFERKRNALSLTPKGALFYEDACKIHSEYCQITQALSSKEGSARRLRIAVSAGIMPFYLTAALALLEAQSPGLQPELLDDTVCRPYEALLSGQIDLYFAPVLSRRPEALRQADTAAYAASAAYVSLSSREEITHYAVSPARPQVLLPPGHRLSSKGSLSLKELAGECFILYPPTKDAVFRDFQLANLNASGITHSVYEGCSSLALAQALVAVGKGVFLSPMPLPENLPDSAHIPLTDISRPAVETLFFRKNPDNPDVLFFVKHFKQYIKETFGYENRTAL